MMHFGIWDDGRDDAIFFSLGGGGAKVGSKKHQKKNGQRNQYANMVLKETTHFDVKWVKKKTTSSAP